MSGGARWGAACREGGPAPERRRRPGGRAGSQRGCGGGSGEYGRERGVEAGLAGGGRVKNVEVSGGGGGDWFPDGVSVLKPQRKSKGGLSDCASYFEQLVRGENSGSPSASRQSPVYAGSPSAVICHERQRQDLGIWSCK